MENCFSNEILQELFKCDENACLLTTESYQIEYKENFNIDADILKTMNGLANNKGGYIIFGIESNTRKLKGLHAEKINFYLQKMDSEEVRGEILIACQPNMEYKHIRYSINGVDVIIIFVEESKNKPHIFTISQTGIKPGDIFYRYNDSIKKIQYAELNTIIESKRIKEQDKWMKFLGSIAKIGLDNVLIIDAKNGTIFTSENSGNGIPLDDNILSKFKLIKERQFNEIIGDPTLKIIGHVAFQTQTGRFELSTDINNALDTNETHPYRASDIFSRLVKEDVKTKDNKLLTDGNISYHRVRFYIVNNNLNKGIENFYFNKAGNTKTYSEKVYNDIKTAFQNMTLSEIETYKLNKKEG